MIYLYWLQILILLGGTIFAWVTVVGNSAVVNPLLTTCFYGAIALTLAFVGAVYITALQGSAKKLWQKYLTWLVAAGTVFAWGNFSYVAWKFYNHGICNTGCLEGLSSPFQSSCFFGALIFSGALIVALTIYFAPKE